jgi:hypothetical protein
MNKISEAPGSINVNPVIEEINKCLEEGEEKVDLDVIESINRVVTNGACLDKIAKDILDKQGFSRSKREKFTTEMYERSVRGMMFEQIALDYMEKKGEPEDPDLSNIILSISRNPKGFLSSVHQSLLKEYVSETDSGKKYEIEMKIKKIRSEIDDPNILKFPSNSDAIAIRTKGGKDNIEIRVVGSIEIKNYNFMRSETTDEVLQQLERSKHDTVFILDRVLKYLPYYYRKNGREISDNVFVNSEEDFTQTIVQPDVYRTPDSPEKAFLEKSGIIVETLGITPRKLAEIATIIEPEIRKRMNNLQRFGYKPKV